MININERTIVDEETSLNSSTTSTNGVEIMTLPEFEEDISASLRDTTRFSHIILQSRQFVDGQRCRELFGRLAGIQAKRLILNIDASARKNFDREFNSSVVTEDRTIRNTHTQYSSIPILGNYVGRNHVRMIVLGEEAYISSFDFAEPSFDRDELFIKISHPELVQMTKIVSMWNYESRLDHWKTSAAGYDLIFDTGKTNKGYVSKYAEKELESRGLPGTKIWMVSSWHPDKLISALNRVEERDCELNLLVNKQYEYEGMKKIPFNLTKIASQKYFMRRKEDGKCNIYNPANQQMHGKLVLIENGDQIWWLVGTDNFTNFGSNAKTTEIAIAGDNKGVGRQLRDYIEGIDKIKVH